MWWSIPMWIFTSLYVVGCSISIVITIMRRHRPPLNARVLSLSLLSSLFGMALSITFTLQMTHPQYVDCRVVLAFAILILPFWCVPYFLSCFRVIFKYVWNTKKLEGQGDWLSRYGWIVSTKSLYMFLFGVTMLHVLAAIISEFEGYVPESINPIFNCTQKHNISISVLGLIYVAGLSVVVLKLLFINDIYHIKTELIIALIAIAPYFPLWIFAVFGFIPIHPSIFPIVSSFKAFLVTVLYPLCLTYTKFWSNYNPVSNLRLSEISWDAESVYFNRSSSDRRPSEASTIKPSTDDVPMKTQEDISDWYLLEKPEYFENIKHFSIQAWCVELIVFYTDVKALRNMEQERVEAEIKRIYEQFIKVDAPLELEISDITKKEVGERIGRGEFTKDIYDRAFEEVCYMIKKNLIPPWKRSNLFLQLQANAAKSP